MIGSSSLGIGFGRRSRANRSILEETVERDLRECFQRGNCAAIVCDPYQLHGTITRLQKQGLLIRELSQTVGNTTAFSQSLYDAIKGRNLQMYAAADLRTMAMNAVAVETGRGSRLAKEKSSKKIDGVIALAMAAHTAIAVGQGGFHQVTVLGYGPSPAPATSFGEASQARIAAHNNAVAVAEPAPPSPVFTENPGISPAAPDKPPSLPLAPIYEGDD